MGFNSSFRISGSALTAQRLRMDVISSNIANASTTRTTEGGPYQKKSVVLGELAPRESSGLLGWRRAAPEGVRVARIEQHTGVRLVNNPAHPDADENGNVAYPDIDLVQEMVDMMSAVRAYEASVTAFNAAKSMAMKALELGKA